MVGELRQAVADGYYPQGEAGQIAQVPSPDYSMEGSSPEEDEVLFIYLAIHAKLVL